MDTETESTEVVETPTTVTLPDAAPPANDNTDDDAAPSNDNATPEQRASRRERRADRFREARERADGAERRLAAAETERQAMAQQIAELRGRQEAMWRQQTQTQGDPYEKQINDLEAKAKRHLATAASSKDQAVADAELSEYHKTLRAASALDARRETAAAMERFRGSMPDPATSGMRVSLESEFPWLPSNEAARNAADAYIALLMNRDKRPNNIATYREACAMAARDFSLGGNEKASAASRAAYNGISARTGAGGDDGRTHLQMSSDDNGKMKIMAKQLYPHLEPEDAYKKWLKDVGPGLAKK